MVNIKREKKIEVSDVEFVVTRQIRDRQYGSFHRFGQKAGYNNNNGLFVLQHECWITQYLPHGTVHIIQHKSSYEHNIT